MPWAFTDAVDAVLGQVLRAARQRGREPQQPPVEVPQLTRPDLGMLVGAKQMNPVHRIPDRVPQWVSGMSRAY